jgi:hypothetical protein
MVIEIINEGKTGKGKKFPWEGQQCQEIMENLTIRNISLKYNSS